MQKAYSIIAIIAVGVFIYFMGIYLHDNGRATDNIRNKLESIERSQQDADAKLGRIEKGTAQSIVRTEVITRTVESVVERNDRSKERLAESERIIAESKSILSDIRKTKQPTQN